MSVGRILALSGTLIRSRGPPPTLRPGRSMRACPPDRQNLPRTRIGYCDRDRLSASGQPIRMGPGVVLARLLRRRSWGFARHEAVRRPVIGVSDLHVVRFPPINRVHSHDSQGLATKLQTTAVKDVENRLLWARWSAFWGKPCLVWLLFAREAAIPCANPMGRALTRDIARLPMNMRVGGAANTQGVGLTCGLSGQRASQRVCVHPGGFPYRRRGGTRRSFWQRT